MAKFGTRSRIVIAAVGVAAFLFGRYFDVPPDLIAAVLSSL